jgi:hypothetical protein
MRQSTPISATRPEKVKDQPQVLNSLPRWEQIPPEYQREVVMTLATILIKRLANSHHRAEEESDE